MACQGAWGWVRPRGQELSLFQPSREARCAVRGLSSLVSLFSSKVNLMRMKKKDGKKGQPVQVSSLRHVREVRALLRGGCCLMECGFVVVAVIISSSLE